MKRVLLSRAFLLLLVPGCAGYRARSLSQLSPTPTKEDKNVHFSAKAFTVSDCDNYLDRNVIKCGFRPIQIAIRNETEMSLKFSLGEINMEITGVDYVVHKTKQSPMSRALAYGIPGLLTPLLIGTPLLVAAICDPIWACQANERQLQDYVDKALSDRYIEPRSRIEGLVFVSTGKYINELMVKLHDRDSEKTIECTACL